MMLIKAFMHMLLKLAFHCNVLHLVLFYEFSLLGLKPVKPEDSLYVWPVIVYKAQKNPIKQFNKEQLTAPFEGSCDEYYHFVWILNMREILSCS